MNHIMHLRPHFFKTTLNNKKTVEIRLADEKRKLCNIGDIITFYELPKCLNSINVVIDSINYINSISDLYSDNILNNLGIDASGYNLFINELQDIYPKYKINKYGLLAIQFHIFEENLKIEERLKSYS